MPAVMAPGLVLDRPRRLPHPLRWLGWLALGLEEAMRRLVRCPHMIPPRLCGPRWAAVVALLTLSVFAAHAAEAGRQPPKRIISLAPSTTEMLFSLGLGDRVVGVTRYCDYPPAAAAITKVGGYVDPSYEGIVALKPDLIVLLTSHRDTKTQLEKMRLRTLTVPHETIQDIHEAIRSIGEACGEVKGADALLSGLTNRTQAVCRAVKGRDRPRVLVCIGRDFDSGQLTGMYIAGRKGFYDQIIELAGGLNACPGREAAYPQVSAEGVIRLDPDVIIDLISQMNPGKGTPAQMERQWAQLGMVAAVRKGRVHVIVGNQALRPGPRYIDFLEQLARLLHPEAFTGHDSDAGRGTGH